MINPKLKFLEDVPWDNSLRLSNGKTVHGLEQLPMVIKFSDDEVFDSHVTADKNDFANWIRNIIGDVELADKLLTIRTKDEFLKFMEQAIIDIKNYKAPEPVVQPTPQPAPQSIVQPIVHPAVQPIIIPQPTSQPVLQPATQPSTIVQPVVEPIVQQPTPVATSNPMPVAAPVFVPVIASVVASVAEPILMPSAVPQPPSLETTSDIIEEIFDFEEIFKVLIAELDQEVLSWDMQTS